MITNAFKLHLSFPSQLGCQAKKLWFLSLLEMASLSTSSFMYHISLPPPCQKINCDYFSDHQNRLDTTQYEEASSSAPICCTHRTLIL